ncbi:glycosyltransferase 87 family protein [Haloechinothrix sp. LS1_15]|uniref:glycosyltransferase 87 family protein n=1 Tax=Haloechinothrix sp. LS1_15 TaxID=2652248 RepID=UPI00294AB804|nr:glycosyltransferase 87 family protein [Haloechinothrix sp. LS1_15]
MRHPIGPSWSPSPRAAVVLTALLLLVVAIAVAGWLHDWRLGVDSAVYRAGAVALLSGDPLYDSMSLPAEPWWALLPFTYPPPATVLFLPLTLLPVQLAWGAMAVLSILALALSIRVTLGSLPWQRDLESWYGRWGATPAAVTVLFTVALLAIEPVWRTIALGQVNLVLMAVIMLDVLVLAARDHRLGGVLIGLAAAVKLTPLIFIPHLVLTGRVRAAVRAAVTFLVLQAVMVAVIPRDAVRFWGDAVIDPGRTGPIHWAGNQSINGVVHRLTELAPWSFAVSVVVAGVAAVPAVWLVRRFHRDGQPLPALLVTAFFGLLVSPVSWSHHWVWAVPLIVVLVARLGRPVQVRTRHRWQAFGVIAVFTSCVLLVLPNGRNLELHWSWWQHLLGSAYVAVPVVVALVLLGTGLRLGRSLWVPLGLRVPRGRAPTRDAGISGGGRG